MDLVRGVDSDEEVDLVPSDDDVDAPVAATKKAPSRGISWRGLQDGDSDDEDGDLKEAPATTAKSSWSFREAIDRIDASSSRTFHGTSLKEKVAAATRRKDTPGDASRKALSDSESSGSGDDESADDDDDDDDESDDNDEDGGEADESDADDDSEESDDNEGGERQEMRDSDEKGDSSSAVEDAAPATSLAPRRKDDDIAGMLASARPNPLRARTGGASASRAAEGGQSHVTDLEEQYQAFFAPDPFGALPADKEGHVAAGSKRRREAAAAEAAGGAGSAVAAAPVIAAAFTDMNLSRPLLRAIAALGYTAPTPIQTRVIPLALAGHDVCGSAVTGSGKTAAYLLPILERLLFKPSRSAAIRVLILTPTRELATQVHSMSSQLAQFCPDIRAALVVGGLSLKHQEADLRGRPDIVVATPGRMLDHIRNSLAVHCDDVDVLVLDEADRLLEMGFEDEVTEVVRACPVGRQTLLFSATMTARVETLVKLSLRKPVRVTADPLFDMAQRLVQEFVRIKAGREDDREALLLALVSRSFTGGGVLIFAVHKHTAHRLAILLTLAGLSVAELHGNLTQRQRLSALEDFREARVDYLIATDLAGRGLDIAGVRCVINFEMPKELTAYVHRVGRTARAGRAGVAVTLVSEGQRSLMKDVVRHAALNVRSRVVAPEVIAQWRQWLEDQAPAVDAVIAAEREEREMRLAEVDAQRADNLLEHTDEIKARPARTWFQSEREKVAVRKAAASAAEGTSGDVAPAQSGAADARQKGGKKGERGAPASKLGATATGQHRLNRRKRRRLEASAALDAEERRIHRLEQQGAREAEGRATEDDGRPRAGGGGRRGADAAAASPASFKLDKGTLRVKRAIEATRHVHSAAKAAKAAVRERAVASGVPVSAVQRLLHKSKKSTKRRDSSAALASFDDDAAGSGAPSRKASAGKPGASGPLGRKAFKSKARFKRR